MTQLGFGKETAGARHGPLIITDVVLAKGRQKLTVSSTQRLALNQSLTASIEILAMDRLAINHLIDMAAEQNPAVIVEKPQMARAGEWLPRWTNVLSDHHAFDEETHIAASPSMIAHVMQVVGQMNLSRADWKVALAFVEGLEPTGWLGIAMKDVAARTGADVQDAERVLKRLQKIDPAGLFARSLIECLRLQALDQSVLTPVMDKVLDHLDLLARGETGKIAKTLGIDEADVLECFGIIRCFNPKPGTIFAPETARARIPDLTCHPRGPGRWEVTLNRQALAMVSVARKSTAHSADQRRQAATLAKSINARNETLLAVARELSVRQGAALENGMRHLAPLTMRRIAEHLGVHESTVSRVVSTSSMDTPNGPQLLRAFFSPVAGRNAQGKEVSSTAMRSEMARLLAKERADKPLRDQQLVDALAQATGVVLSRRTIAQYRETAGIPIASRRQRNRAIRPNKGV